VPARGAIRVALVHSQAAQIVAKQELDLALPARPQDARGAPQRYRAAPGTQVYGRDDWYAPIASGSSPSDAIRSARARWGTPAVSPAASPTT
jgi:4-hydroxy-3-polyprenylbenzoate decarboxylase